MVMFGSAAAKLKPTQYCSDNSHPEMTGKLFLKVPEMRFIILLFMINAVLDIHGIWDLRSS